MSLIDETELQNAREDAEEAMVDQCEIRRASTTSPTVDPSTGLHTSVPGAVLYRGKCKRQSPPGVRAELDVDAGDRSNTLSRMQLHLPASAVAIPKDAVGVMLACPFEPTSVGRRFVVDGPAGKSMATAQRLNVTEVVR